MVVDEKILIAVASVVTAIGGAIGGSNIIDRVMKKPDRDFDHGEQNWKDAQTIRDELRNHIKWQDSEIARLTAESAANRAESERCRSDYAELKQKYQELEQKINSLHNTVWAPD